MKKENLLSSWKEIASYLDCDVRTCHRWEKEFGLPVHRLGDSVRSRVFAYREELDQWMAERGNNTHLRTGYATFTDRKHPLSLGWRIAIIAAIFLTSALAVYLIFFNNSASSSAQKTLASKSAMSLEDPGNQTEARPGGLTDPQPADFKIDGSALIIINKAGRELFRFDTGLVDLMDEAYYRDHFQIKKLQSHSSTSSRNTIVFGKIFPQLIIKDLTNDGYREVLFAPHTKSDLGENTFYCFNQSGEERWHYKTGRRLKYGSFEYPDLYRTDKLWAEDIDGDGLSEIFALANHRYDFPSQFLLLNAEGNEIGEYWNTGRMCDFAFCDVNRDGRKEILIAGMNNDYESPVLIVFNQNMVEGSSPPHRDFFRCSELLPGNELYYIQLPSEKDFLFPRKMDTLYRIEITENDLIEVETSIAGIIYYFDLKLGLESIRLTNRFEVQYNKKIEEGRYSEPFDHDAISAQLRREIRWWDGDDWVATPTMTKYWRDRRR